VMLGICLNLLNLFQWVSSLVNSIIVSCTDV
jgi:hypothetical protein